MSLLFIGRMTVADWIALLEHEAKTRWDNGKLLLLSQIPPVLRENGIDVHETLAGRPLLTALKLEGAGHIALVQHPIHSAVWAALPKNVADANDARTIFPLPTTPNIAVFTEDTQKFQPWFWAAFVKVLEPGRRRWLLANSFVDHEAAAPQLAENAYEVTRADIVNPGPSMPVDRVAVLKSIEAWAVRNRLELSRFELSHGNHRSQEIARAKIHLPFDSLDSDDLKRIVVPLDIVMKLLRR